MSSQTQHTTYKTETGATVLILERHGIDHFHSHLLRQPTLRKSKVLLDYTQSNKQLFCCKFADLLSNDDLQLSVTRSFF